MAPTKPNRGPTSNVGINSRISLPTGLPMNGTLPIMRCIILVIIRAMIMPPSMHFPNRQPLSIAMFPNACLVAFSNLAYVMGWCRMDGLKFTKAITSSYVNCLRLSLHTKGSIPLLTLCDIYTITKDKVRKPSNGFILGSNIQNICGELNL